MIIPRRAKNSLSSPLIILIIVIALCFLCGFCRAVTDVGSDKTSNARSPATQTRSATIPSSPSRDEIRSLAAENTAATPTKLSETDGDEAETGKNGQWKIAAVVVTENANLRATPDANGAVIDTFPEGTKVEVIKQRGAWFYVRAAPQTGWIHGNTIKYKNSASNDLPATSDEINEANVITREPLPARAVPSLADKKEVKETREEINASGASARCRDGSLSYSAHRRGTCSHHGGVAVWY